MNFRKTSFTLLLLAAVTLSACDFDSTETVVNHQETYPPEFRTNDSDFKNEVLRIIPAEDITWSSSVSQINGGEETHALNIEILNPEEFSNPVVFYSQANEVKEQAEKSIENMKQYDKIFVKVEEKSFENGSERTRTQKREISL